MSDVIDLKSYICNCTTVKDRIARYDTIISNLEAQIALASVGDDQQNLTVEEYQFNDGQVVVRTKYRSLTEMSEAITMFEKLRQSLINRCGGRITILRNVRSASNILRNGY